MDDTARRIRRTITLLRSRGYFAPDHATAAASKLSEAAPLPAGFAFVAAALIRHAATLAPFDRKKLRLAKTLNDPMRHGPFDTWMQTARKLTHNDPVPERLAMPTAPADLVEYMERQPANAFRLTALTRLRHSGDIDAFQAGVQIISGSPSGLLAAPIMAWHAHFLGEDLLAQMLLDEGVPNFLSRNLQAVNALKSGDAHQAALHLTESLEQEPFQPGLIETMAGLRETAFDAVAHLREQHGKVGHKMSLKDVQVLNREIRDIGVDDFIRVLDGVLPGFRANATIFWQTLALSLR